MGDKPSMSETTSSKDAITTTTASSCPIHLKKHITQDFLLIWIDISIDQSNSHYQNTLAQLRSIVNSVNIFTQPDEGIDFLTEADDRKAFLILGGTLGQQIVPLIHDIPQLGSVYIFRDNEPDHDQWVKAWVKVKGAHTEIKPICESLQKDIKQCNHDFIAVSFVPPDEGFSNKTLDQLEPSFMYTQIFKEILLNMEHDRQSVKDFTTFCRTGDYGPPSNIDRFENEYPNKSAVWWYTLLPFTYSILNCALRTLEAEVIIKMGFFIHDLHNQIQQLHQKQVDSYHGQSFTVYRGQGLSITDFNKLLKTKGGLMSFNNFLSTSRDRDVSLIFATSASITTDMVGILFQMIINPSVASVPFASIVDVTNFQEEEEILFSMHSVFRIGEINKIDNNNSLYQVDLTLTADDDQELRTLTDQIRNEVMGKTGWQRLGVLLLKISQFDKAEELYNLLLEQTSDQDEKAVYYNNLGCIKNGQGDYDKAIGYYEKTLEICQKILPQIHPLLDTSYNNIGLVYDNMGEYSEALSFHEKTLEIRQKTLPQIHPLLANSYNNIGWVYNTMGEYSKALSFYEKGLEIDQKTLPANHPNLATFYNNIGSVYDNMREYSKALLFYEKGLEIRQKTLPQNHPSLATSYNNAAGVYYHMGDYSKALSFYEKALEIYQKAFSQNHPDLATSYSNIGSIYDNMGEYLKALSFYEKTLEIRRKTLPQNHPDLATSYNNIGLVYDSMGDYSKALSFYEKALEIYQKTLPSNHSSLVTSYNNAAGVCYHMGEYSKAVSYFERTLNILESSLPSNHPDIKTVQGMIEMVKKEIVN